MMRGTGISGPEVGGVIASATAAIYATFLRPLTKRGRERHRQDKLMRLWFTGADGVMGVSPVLVPAPIQLAKVQEDVAVILNKVDSILNIVSPEETK